MAEGGTSEIPKFTLVTSTDPLRYKLWQAQQQGNFSDFHIEVNGIRTPCHKLILSAQSEYFSCMLQHENTVEVTQGFVAIQLLDVDAVKLVVDFMYSGRIEFEADMVQEVTKVMDRFQLTENILREKISEYIISHLCSDNCIGWFKFGEQMNLNNIKTEAHSIMMQGFSDVCNSSEWLDLSFSELKDYVQKIIRKHSHHDHSLKAFVAWARHDASDHSYHDHYLKAFVTWAMHDASKRSPKLDEMLQIIKLKKCSTREVKHFYKEHKKGRLTNFDLLHQINTALSRAIPEPSGSTLDVIVAGGCTESHVYNRKTWIVNLESGSSIEKASQTKDAYGAAICACPDGLIIAGGTPNGRSVDLTADCVLYHKNTDTWIEFPSLQAPTGDAGATCVQRTLLVVLGGYMYQKHNKAVCLDLKTRNWTICDDMPQAMVIPIVASIAECIFVICSTLKHNTNTRKGTEISVQCYDTTTSTWTFKSPLPASIKTTIGAQTVTMADLLYLVGGEGPICARYDPSNDNWTVLTPPLNALGYGSALTVNGKIILSGGCRSGKIKDSIEEYDPFTNTWRLLPVKLPAPLYRHCMTLV